MYNRKMAESVFPGARPKHRQGGEPNFGFEQGSAANRRKKKRAISGMRTIDIARGRFGFGFTLSGQSPCILSSVISGSPAERVGLRSGDCLVGVQGRNVSKIPHNDVVKLISGCTGSLRVQIADGSSYQGESGSSSSEDEGVRPAVKFPGVRKLADRGSNKPLAELSTNRDLWRVNNPPLVPSRLEKSHHMETYSDSESCRTETPKRHVRSNSADSSMIDLGINQKSPPKMSTPKRGPQGDRLVAPNRRNVDLNAMEELSLGADLSSFLNQNLNELRKSMKIHNQRRHNIDISNAESKCVVGYLGTIEMPKGIDKGSGGLQEIRNCVRRLRVEKKVHTLVLFCIFPNQVVLINHHGLKLAEFPAQNIKFCGVYADDRRFFGLVTSRGGGARLSGDDQANSASCHVFMVEPIHSQAERRQRATTFQFELSYNGSDCSEFPDNADPILDVIYRVRGLAPSLPGQEDPSIPLQEVESTSSSTGSSNSDSGIGYRDEALQPQGAERALVVDVQNERIRMQNLTRIQQEQEERAVTEANISRRLSGNHNISLSSSDGDRSLTGDVDNGRRPEGGGASARQSTSKLTVRAMPDPVGSTSQPNSADSSFNTDRLESFQSAEHIRLSMQKYLQDKHEHLKKTSQQLVSPPPITPSNKRLYDRLTRPLPSSPRNTPSFSDRSCVRSLEDLRSAGDENFSPSDLDGAAGPPSLPVNPNLPLARFLYSSDSNLSHIETVIQPPAMLDLASHPLNKWQQKQGGYNNTVLRPCDQYPVLDQTTQVKRRSRSQLSGAGSSHRASVHVESSEYDKGSWRDLTRMSSSIQSATVCKTQSLQRPNKTSGEVGNGVEFDRASCNGDLCSSRGSLSTIGRVNQRQRRKSDSASIIGPDAVGKQDDAVSTTGSQGCASPGKSNKDIGRVGGWAADFDKLLADEAGLQTFAEYLKKEFSHENIYFWCACQKYKSMTESGVDRLRIARDIIERHLDPGATEPVNVDSAARSSTQENLSRASNEQPPDLSLFTDAQAQIYSLMKFDSFTRFLKSDIYKNSLLADMAGNPLPFDGQDLDFDLLTGHDLSLLLDKSDSSNKSKEGEPGVRRKSLLPWNNIRNRSKSKDRPGGEGSANTGDSKPSFIKKLTGQVSGSRVSVPEESPNQSDPNNHSAESCSKESCTLTRFILPDRATTVVSTGAGETIRTLVSRLLDKRGLKFTSFDAFVTGSEKPLDLSEDCSSLGCSEVRVEPRVLFRLELPSKKSIGVKAKQTKLVEEVLGPILNQYGWNLEAMSVRLDGQQSRVDMKASVTSIDNSRLVVTPIDELNTSEAENISVRSGDSRPGSSNSGMGPRRQSSSSVESLMPPPQKIPATRRRPTAESPVGGNSNRDQEASLYEGLKRMTKGRLDDQRGLEINTEMPEFLKNSGRVSEPLKPSEKGHINSDLQARLSGPPELVSSSGWDRDHARNFIDYIDSTFTSDGVGLIPSHAEADKLFNPGNRLADPDESLHFNESRHSLGLGPPRPRGGSTGGGVRLVQRPSIGVVRDYEGINFHQGRESLGSYGSSGRESVGGGHKSGRGTPTSRDYDRTSGSVLTSANSRDYERTSGLISDHQRTSGLISDHHPVIRTSDYEGVNFKTTKDYEHLSYRGGVPIVGPPLVAPKPRLQSVEEDAAVLSGGKEGVVPPPKRPPPPLPPKPTRGPPPLPPHAQHLHENFGKVPPQHQHNGDDLPMGVTRTKSGVYLAMPGEKGYNVSFV